jgi:ferric-dicitrate binding protein FerR (iron transport regulator)
MSNNHISEDLIARYLAGEVTSGEADQVNDWIAESEENRIEFERYQEIWALSSQIDSPKIDVDKAWLKAKLRMQEEVPNRIIPLNVKTRFPWLRIAAVFTGILGLATWLILTNGSSDFIEYASNDKTLDIYLPDSSHVILSPNSKYRFDNSSYGDKSRTSFLEGEALFDVRKNPDSPFIIELEQSQVEVLGTSFLVHEASNHQEVTVSVVTGRVKLSDKKEKENSVILIHDQSGTWHANQPSIDVDSINTVKLNYTLHKTIIFEQTKLSEVCLALQAIFGRDIELKNPFLNDCMLTATFKDQSITEILEIIAGTFSLEIISNDRGFELDGKGCQ